MGSSGGGGIWEGVCVIWEHVALAATRANVDVYGSSSAKSAAHTSTPTQHSSRETIHKKMHSNYYPTKELCKVQEITFRCTKPRPIKTRAFVEYRNLQ